MRHIFLTVLALGSSFALHHSFPPDPIKALGAFGMAQAGTDDQDSPSDLVELETRLGAPSFGWGRITKTYPGRTHALRLADHSLLPIKWEMVGNAPGIEPVATVDPDSGVAQFNRVGVAVFRIPMFVGKVKTVRFAIIEVVGQDMRIDFDVKQALLVGESADGITSILFKEDTGEERQVQRPVTLTVENDQIMQLSSDTGATFGRTVKTQPGEPVRIRGGSTGKTTVTVAAAGVSKVFSFEVIKPVLKLKASTQKPTQGSTVTVTASVLNGKGEAIKGYDFVGELSQEGAETRSNENQQISVDVNSQGDIKFAGKFAAKGIEGTEMTAQLTLPIQPVVAHVLLDRFKSKIVTGDKVKLPITLLDPQNKPVDRKDRGDTYVEILEQQDKNWIAAEGIGVELISDTDSDSIRVSGTRVGVPYRLAVHTKSEGGELVTGQTGNIEFVPEVEVVASRVMSEQHARDLFGGQVVRENLVYSVTAINNLGAVEDSDLVRGGTVQLYGATLLMPVKIERKLSGKPFANEKVESVIPAPILGGTETNEEFRESSEQEIAEFAAGRGKDAIYVLVPPLYAESFSKVKDAIEYRDPARVAQRFFNTLNEIAKVLYTGFPLAHSNPFRGEEDPKKRDLAVGFLSMLFSQYENEAGKKGKFGPDRMLAESSEVSPDKPKVFYYLVPKDTWRRVEQQSNLKVTFYPQCHVKVTYAKVVAQGKSQPSVTPTTPPPANPPHL